MNQEKMVPELRFTGFEGDWESTKLNEVLYETKKRNFSKRFTRNDVLSVSGEHGVVNQIGLLGRSYAGESVDNYHIVETGDIVYTKSPLKTNPYGIIKINKGVPGIVSTLYAVYGVKDKLYGPFLDFYFQLDDNLNNYLRPLVRKGAKNDMKINNAHVISASIYIPPKLEQEKIASFLSRVDTRIQQLTRKKALLEQYKKGVMQRIFSREVRFKDENLEKFPEWESKQLGKIATFSKGKGISKIDITDEGSLECIRYGELYTHYKEVITEIKSRTSLSRDGLILSEKNDVIIPASGETQLDIAKACCVLKEGVALGGDLNILKTNLNGVFLSYYLNCIKKIEIANLAQGNSVVHLYSSQLKELWIEIPSLPEQQKIASFLTTLDTKIQRVNQQLETTRAYKKSLLQRMFV